MTTTRYDFAVIGGGPAGLATSALLAAAGASVLLLDAGHRGWKAGEFLHPSVKAFVDRLAILPSDWQSAHLPTHGFVNGWATTTAAESDFLFSPHGHGLCLDRERFETQLVVAARNRGVDARIGAVVAGVERLPRHRWSVVYKSQSEHRSAEAGALVLATGRVGRSLTPDVERVRFDGLAWLAARIPAVHDDPRPSIACFPWGWAYITPLPGECSHLYLFFDPRHGPPCRRSLQSLQLALAGSDRLGAWIGSLEMSVGTSIEWLAGAAHSALARGADVDGRHLIGDLAEARDPLATSGIHHALRDASRLCSLLLSDQSHAKATAELAAERKQSFLEYLETRRAFYRMEARWPTSPFWAGEGARFQRAT